MRNEKDVLIGVRDELRSFAEGYRTQMSVNVYNYIWNIVQGIDHDLEELKK